MVERDVQSAQSFIKGFFPEECASTQLHAIVKANTSTPALDAAASDDFPNVCVGAAKEDIELQFGGSSSAQP